MVCYLKELGVQAPALNKWTMPSVEGQQAEEVSLNWGEPWTPFQIKGLLTSLVAQRRAASISKLTDCQELEQGCDWTIHRKLLKQFKGKKKERFLKSVWQGTFYAATSKGHFICSKCGVKAGQLHALVECQWWDEIGESLPTWWRKEKGTSPALWNRAICPARDTTHPTYAWGDESVQCHGIFEEAQIQARHLVFATDASGGRYSSDHRLRVTTWSVVAFTPENEGLKELGYMTGVCKPGTSVPTAEAEALNRCLARVQGNLDVTIDCAPAISQLESKSFKEKHWPAWTQWAEKGRLKPVWVRSHSSEQSFREEFGADQLWRRTVNGRADQLCGQRSAQILCQDHVQLVESRDELIRQISLFLAHRAERLLTSEEAPKAHLSHDTSKVFQKRKTQGPRPKQLNQNRPAEDGGLNKLERMKLMVQNGAGGHDWQWRKSSMNSISCNTCSLYVEQICDLPRFAFLEKHPCRHQEAEWSPLLKKHDSRRMYNLGHAWICTNCHAVVLAGAKKTPARVEKPCEGRKTHNPTSKLLPQQQSKPLAQCFGKSEGPGVFPVQNSRALSGGDLSGPRPKQAFDQDSDQACTEPDVGASREDVEPCPSPRLPENPASSQKEHGQTPSMPAAAVSSLSKGEGVATRVKGSVVQESEAAPKPKARVKSKAKAKKEAVAASQKITSFFR